MDERETRDPPETWREPPAGCKDWGEIAQALANMPREGVRRFVAALVTQWQIARRDPHDLVELLSSEVKHSADADEGGR
jgi:hypothetical protein